MIRPAFLLAAALAAGFAGTAEARDFCQGSLRATALTLREKPEGPNIRLDYHARLTNQDGQRRPVTGRVMGYLSNSFGQAVPTLRLAPLGPQETKEVLVLSYVVPSALRSQVPATTIVESHMEYDCLFR